MAGFQTKTFTKHDDYTTPKSAWENILQYIPKDKVIWESFYADGTSGTYLQELGFNVIHKQVDFFENDLGDILISNPPFTMKEAVFKRLIELGKPFIMILPCSTITCQYTRRLFADQKDRLQIIIPRKRIQFVKIVDKKIKETPNKCNFDCFYYCWKMNLPNDIVWLDDEKKPCPSGDTCYRKNPEHHKEFKH